eukprot:5480334-Karenia_brevis.AAC.1
MEACKSTPMVLEELTVVPPGSEGVDGHGSSTQQMEAWGMHQLGIMGNMGHWMEGRQSQEQS